MHRQTLALIFQKEPAQWGLRGDPQLWREMAARLGSQPFPDTEKDLKALLEQTFQQITEKSIEENERSIFIERYGHGGMSSGQVAPQFWRETGFPLLLEQYRNTK